MIFVFMLSFGPFIVMVYFNCIINILNLSCLCSIPLGSIGPGNRKAFPIQTRSLPRLLGP